MISYHIFINMHSRVTPPEKHINLFEGSTDHIQYQIDDMESSVDGSNKSNSEELKKSITPRKHIIASIFLNNI